MIARVSRVCATTGWVAKLFVAAIDCLLSTTRDLAFFQRIERMRKGCTQSRNV